MGFNRERIEPHLLPFEESVGCAMICRRQALVFSLFVSVQVDVFSGRVQFCNSTGGLKRNPIMYTG